jgi:hypothetical protein
MLMPDRQLERDGFYVLQAAVSVSTVAHCPEVCTIVLSMIRNRYVRDPIVGEFTRTPI